MKRVVTNRTEENQQMDAKQLYVNGDYAKVSPTWHLEDSAWKAEQIIRVFDFHPTTKSLKICDIGCGVGGVLVALDELLRARGIYTEMTGYDIAPVAIDRARMNYKERENITFECCSALSLDRLDCDLCLLIDVLEHLDNPRDFIIKLSEIGPHDFVIHLPLENNWLGIMRGKTDSRRSPVGHLHFFDTHSALNLLEGAGLKVIKRIYCSEFDLDARLHRTFRSLLAYLPRKVLFHIWPALTAHTIGGVSLMTWCSRT